MELIKPEDPQYFTQTSSDSYDRHHYELIFNDNQSSIVFDDYEQMRLYWFQCNTRKVYKRFRMRVNE